MRHVSGRVNVNQPTHSGHHQHHHDGELVHLQIEARAKIASGNPGEEFLVKRTCPDSKNSRTASSAPRNDSPVDPIATPVTILFGHFAPSSPFTAEPSSGSSGTIHKYSSIGYVGIRV